jgi:hypothetical protein
VSFGNSGIIGGEDTGSGIATPLKNKLGKHEESKNTT